MAQTTQNYFQQLLSPPKSSFHAQNSQKKCVNSIMHGSVIVEPNQKRLLFSSQDIKKNISQIERQIFMKNIQLKKEMNKLKTIMNNHSQKNSERKQKISHRMKSKSINQSFQKSISSQSESQMRIKHLKKLKVKLRKQKQQSQRKKTQNERESNQKFFRENEEIKKLQRAEKIHQIKERLQKLNDAKKRRLQILSSKSMPMLGRRQLPHYKRMQKEDLLYEMKKELEKRLNNRESRLKKRNLLETVGAHQRNYMNNLRIKRSNRIKTQASVKNQPFNEENIDQSHIKSNIRMHSETFVTVKSALKQKIPFILQLKQKQKIFNEKRKKIPIRSNPEKQLQILIQKDKIANPLKYTLLHKKLLTDEQIYSQFQNFSLNFDRQILGNLHFEESKKLMKRQKQKKSNDIKRKTFQYYEADNNKRHKTTVVEPQKQQVQSSKIDLNVSRKQSQVLIKKRMRLNTEISNALASSERKSKIVDILKNQSSLHEDKVLKKIRQLPLQNTYEGTNKLQADIDQQFLKSIKAKIACIDLLEK